jgi:flagellar biosynthesis protein FliR
VSSDTFATLAVTLGLSTLRLGFAFMALPSQGEALPLRHRAALALVLGVSLSPLASVAPGIAGQNALIWAALGEVAFGLVLGFGMRLVLSLADIAGALVGSAMGLSYATFMDPMQGDETSVTAEILRCVVWLAFFAAGGFEVLMGSLVASFHAMPLGALVKIDISGLGGQLDLIFIAAVQIASPVLFGVLFVQVGLAVASRVASELHPLSIAFAALLLVGLWTFSGVVDGAFAYGRTMSGAFEQWLSVVLVT